MKYAPTLILILACSLLTAQNLVESRQTSYYTYIFKLTDKEAKEIYKKDLWQVDDSYFHTRVDSFPTDSIYKKELPAGHYLKVYTDKNRLRFDVTSVQDFDVMIAGNNTDLVIQVYSTEGNIIDDAEVRVRWKKLRFDDKTQSYIDRKSNRKGLLQVTWNDLTAYYDLSRAINNSALKRTTRKLVYGTPVKYVWLPVRYVIFLPIDGVRSLVNGYPQGTIQRTERFFIKAYYKIACLFDDYYCDYWGDNNFGSKYSGYLVFNKPKYLPGDTVKLKSFIVNKHGRPIDKPVNVVLQRPGKAIQLGTITPYRKGGYTYQFVLHDSLELQLDRDYMIWLEKKDDKAYISESFYYEDYELKSIELTLSTDSDRHYSGSGNSIMVSGKDENDLNILDGRLQVFIKSGEVSQKYDDYVYIPDTLAFWNLELDKEDETEIIIPDSIFPRANLEYEIAVTLLTSDNESITERKNLNYFYFSSDLEGELINDSIRFSYKFNGHEKSLAAKISGVDNFGNQKLLFSGVLPVKLQINPYYMDYIIDADTVWNFVHIPSEPSLLECYSERSRDSIRIQVKNPRNIPFSYFIYKRNGEKGRGYSDSLNININARSNQNYYLSVQYLWGGTINEENYQIPYKDKNLKITVLEPKIVYPSQETSIEILVTDPEGNPVPGVDLTAYSITKKFDYSPPEIPYLGKKRKGKALINNFSLNEHIADDHTGLMLDFETWRLLAGIDTIEYYKFIYPGNSIYKSTYDSEITQFSPFVVSEGRILPVHVVYVDSKPVYFSWSTNTRPYSFPVDTGYHDIKLRTTRNTFEIDSICFEASKKTIFSIRDSIVHPNVKISKEESSLSDNEKSILYKYIFPYQYRFGEYYAYIEQNGQVYFLKPMQNNSYYRNLAGPVYPNQARFQLIDSFATDFVPEPFFEYEFMPGLLKMRSVDAEERYPDFVYGNKANESLSDEVLTKGDLVNGWNDFKKWKRYSTARYSYPKSTSTGMGQMEISFKDEQNDSAQKALNILLFRYDDHKFLRIYPGSNLTYEDLAEGYYKCLFFYSGSDYSVVDSLYVSPNGRNFHSLSRPSVTKRDTFSVRVSSIIEGNIFREKPYYQAEETEIQQIYRAYQQEFRYTGTGHFVSGYVYDSEGSPIPGVNVVVEGTTFGTVTNLDGYYSINVPNDRNELIFSFIGFTQEDVDISYKDNANVYMTEDVTRLEEVVVVGYGVNRKSELTASVSVVSSTGIPDMESELVNALQGKVAGIQVFDPGVAEIAASIQLRGTNSIDFEAMPLFVIDGSVYMGNIGDLDPGIIQNIEVLKDEQATALYGSQGAHGVVLINTGGSFRQTNPLNLMGADYDETFLEAASQASSIRDNFSDYAFWKPDLITDGSGKATFTVQFPDDVTSWRTFYLAMNGKKQSGQAEGSVKSYKPLMAQLAVPRFLVEGDTTFAIGKVLNYTTDTFPLKTKFELNGEIEMERNRECTSSLLDTLLLVADIPDSVSVKYLLEKEDGYFDGELRYIPVYPKGLERTAGQFYTLQGDTALTLDLDSLGQDITIYARADVLEVLEDEISKLIDYKYSCNEQLASKLKALLSEQRIASYTGKDFRRENQVEKVIRLLQRNQREDGLWGWWKSSREPGMWISLHVLEALAQAKSMGYRVSIEEGQIAENLVWELESPIDADLKLRALYILKMLNSKVNFPVYIDRIEKTESLDMNELFRLIELKQLCGLGYGIDTIHSFRKETMFGNLYFSNDSASRYFYCNEIQSTLVAYRILRSDPVNDHGPELEKIRNYLFERRAQGNWLNTYESSKIIETILPDILGSDKKVSPPVLILSGDIHQTVNEFPFEIRVTPDDSIQIEKKGDFPVYLTTYSHFWDPAPLEKRSDFEISAGFDGPGNIVLKAGEPIKLVTSVKVKKDADYVMINVPIPAGCSYGNKSNGSYHEVHREYFRNETAIFCENLRAGDYQFEIELIPRYSGNYTINPAKVEMMYFPTFNANTGVSKVVIE